ncbi:MAG: class I tRNA ligase family protein [Chloroflexota bacterium]
MAGEDLRPSARTSREFHDLLAGDALERGLEAPEHVWVHGWLLVAGKPHDGNRGCFLDHAVVEPSAPTRRATCARGVAFDKDTDVSWDSFVRRYNADLANDFGNLVNRTVSMVNRYLEGERPEPRRSQDAPLAATWAVTLDAFRAKLDGYLLHEALTALWDFVGASNKAVDEAQPWALAKLAKAGDADAEAKLRAVLGDLVEACRLVGLAAAPFMPGMAPRILDQLGYAYEYGADGNGGPSVLERLAWGGQAGPGRVTSTPSPLFPRAEVEAVEEAGA